MKLSKQFEKALERTYRQSDRETLNEIAKAKAHLDRFIVALVDAMPDAEERGAHELVVLEELVEHAGEALLAVHRALGDNGITKVEAIAEACDEEGGWNV